MEINFELGKWLLNILKYLITAFLLTTVFGDMSDPWIFVGAILAAVITFGVGYILLKKGKKTGDVKKVKSDKEIYKKR